MVAGERSASLRVQGRLAADQPQFQLSIERDQRELVLRYRVE